MANPENLAKPLVNPNANANTKNEAKTKAN